MEGYNHEMSNSTNEEGENITLEQQAQEVDNMESDLLSLEHIREYLLNSKSGSALKKTLYGLTAGMLLNSTVAEAYDTPPNEPISIQQIFRETSGQDIIEENQPDNATVQKILENGESNYVIHMNDTIPISGQDILKSNQIDSEELSENDKVNHETFTSPYVSNREVELEGTDTTQINSGPRNLEVDHNQYSEQQMLKDLIKEYDLPENTPLETINDHIAEQNRVKLAIEYGLPTDTPLADINDHVAEQNRVK